MLSFDLNMTYKCNFRCDYCFEEKNENIEDISSDTIISFTETILEDKRFKSIEKWKDGIKLIFWGGEPTLKIDVVNDVILHFKKDKRVNYFMYTNGYIIDDVIRISKENERFRFQISYDGYEIHNKHRKTKGGKETADIVKKNIFRCIDEGLNFSLKPVLPLEDIQYIESSYLDYLEIDKYSRERKNPIVKEYFPSFPIIRDCDDNSFTPEQIINIHQQLLKISEYEKEYYKEHGKFLFSWFKEGHKITCGCGNSLFAVDIDGGVYICHGALYSKFKSDHYICNINDKNRLVQNLDQCRRYFERNKFKKRPPNCDSCNVNKCAVCSIIQHQLSNKENYMERLRDYSIQSKICNLYEIATSVSKKIRREIENGNNK